MICAVRCGKKMGTHEGAGASFLFDAVDAAVRRVSRCFFLLALGHVHPFVHACAPGGTWGWECASLRWMFAVRFDRGVPVVLDKSYVLQLGYSLGS